MMDINSFEGFPHDGRVRLVQQLTDESGFYICDGNPIYAAFAADDGRFAAVETACLKLSLGARLRLVDAYDEMNLQSGSAEEVFDIIRLVSWTGVRDVTAFVELCEMHANGGSTLSFEDFFYSLSDLFQPNREQSKLNAFGLFAELHLIDIISSRLVSLDVTDYWLPLGTRSKYDFSFPSGNIEVKGSASEEIDLLVKHSQIFNEDNNFLAFVSLERNPSGETLKELSKKLIKRSNCFNTLESRIKLDRRLLEIDESNLDLPLEAVVTRMYEASRINPFKELPDRVTKLQYRLDLSDVDYLDEVETVETLMIELND
jgi:hypothetical protein